MATAQMVNGKALVAYVGDVAVDSEGVAIPDAPKRQKDTLPSEQPGALGAPTPEERMGIAIASALSGKTPAAKSAAKASAASEPDEDEEQPLPPLAEMEEHLAGLSTAKDVKALQKTDERVGAQKMYEARLVEMKGE